MPNYLDGYKPKSKKLFSGKEGLKKVFTPYITLEFDNTRCSFFIHEIDFALLAVSGRFKWF